MIELLRYQREDGREPFTEWLNAVVTEPTYGSIRIINEILFVCIDILLY